MKQSLISILTTLLISPVFCQIFLETFDGNPSSPESMYGLEDWAFYIHSRDNQYSLYPTIAHHGPNCEPPVRFNHADTYDTTHMITAYEDAIFQCKNHLMTSIRADGYGLINMIPNQLIQIGSDSTVVSFDISTEDVAPGARDWFTFHITDVQAFNPLAAFSFAADLEGHPKNTLRLETHYNNGRFFSLTYIDQEFEEHSIPMISYESLESLIDVSRVVRSKFELRISQDHLKFGILLPSGDYHWWVDHPVEIPWHEAYLLLGHYSYNPRKGGTGMGKHLALG